MNALVTYSTLLFIEYVDTIKPNISVPDFETETLYFFRFFKEQTAYWSKNQSKATCAWLCILGKSNPEQLLRPFHLMITGGGERDRTDDLMLAKHALSQLSYTPDKWWVWMDLNHRPHAYQACALTN
jgi:hypothetical protein